MAEQIQINALIRPELDTGGIVKKVSSIQSLLKKVNLPPSLQKEFDGLFTDFNSSIEKINGQFSKGFETKGAVKSLDSMSAEMRGTVEKIAQAWQQVSSRGDLIKLPPDQDKKLKQINAEIQQLRTKINQVNPSALEQVTQAIDQLKGKAGQKTGSEAMELINQGEAQQAINLLDIIIAKREKMSLTAAESKAGETFRADTLALTQMRDALLSAETETKDLVTQLEQLDADGAKILTQAMDDLGNEIKQTGTDTNSLNQGLEKTEGSMRGAAQGAQEMSSEMDEIKNRIKYFFSLSNAVQLVRQALRQTFEAAKELDAAMTETAVVTNFSVGDMWDMLPEYTKTAQELGATTQGVYETLTLFYQQGLDTNEAMALGTETLKMARIAGMDYEEATSKMTAALRGFNMELNELSAQRVNDVYSELAAITAADTDQIATAMTKTASIANSANMEFETTAAFLSQIIETTQESAETAGTAMKTVIARFTELKKDPSLIGEVDGEVIDANKIETALNSIGVALRDNLTGQFRDLDDVFLDIAQKWEGLDTNTQRYIATIAAGSRQQSRFIAMMSDYERTMELVGAANNSAGSSQAQFDKTLESMEAKLNQLRNTWQEFTLGLMESGLLKNGIDALNGLLSVINKLTSAPGILGSAGKAFIGFFTLFTGKKLFNVASKSIIPNLVGPFTGAGAKAGMKFTEAMSDEFASTKTLIKKLFGKNLIDPKTAQGFKQIFQVEYTDDVFARMTESANNYTQAQLKLEAVQRMQNSITEKGIMTDGKAAVLKNATTAATNSQTAAIEALAVATGLDNAQSAEALALSQAGVPIDAAAMAAKYGITQATLLEALGVEALTDATEEEIRAKMISLVADKTSMLSKIKNIALLLFGNEATRASALAKLGEAGVTWAAKGAQDAFNASLLASPVGWIALAIVALIAVIAGLIAILSTFSMDKQMQAAAESAQRSAEAADQAKESYEALMETIEKHKEAVSNINNLTKGTHEFRQAVMEANLEMLELMEMYPKLREAGMVKINLDGVRELTEEGEAYLNRVKNQQVDNALGISSVGSQALDNTQLRKKTLDFGADLLEVQADSNLTQVMKEMNFSTQFSNWAGDAYGDFVDFIYDDVMLGLVDSTGDGLLDMFEKLDWSSIVSDPEALDAAINKLAKVYNIDEAHLSELTKLVVEYGQAWEEADYQKTQKVQEQLKMEASDELSKSNAFNAITSIYAKDNKDAYSFDAKEISSWWNFNDAEDQVDSKAEKMELAAEWKTADLIEDVDLAGLSEEAMAKRLYSAITGIPEEDIDMSKDDIEIELAKFKLKADAEIGAEDMNSFYASFSALPEQLQDIGQVLMESGEFTSKEIEAWFDENGKLTQQFAEDMLTYEDKYGSIAIKMEVNKKAQTEALVSQVSEVLDAVNSAIISEGSISAIDDEAMSSLVGALGTLPGLYNENITAADEWNTVCLQGEWAQIEYLDQLKAKLSETNSMFTQEELKTQVKQLREQLDAALSASGGELTDEVQRLQQQIADIDSLIEIEVVTNIDDVAREAETLIAKNELLAETGKLIGEDYQVATEDIERLFDVFPELASAVEEYTSTGIKLNKEMTDVITNGLVQQRDESQKTTIQRIDDQILELEAKKVQLQTEFEALKANSEAEGAVNAKLVKFIWDNEEKLTQFLIEEGMAEQDARELVSKAKTGDVQAYTQISQKLTTDAANAEIEATQETAKPIAGIKKMLSGVGTYAGEIFRWITSLGKDSIDWSAGTSLITEGWNEIWSGGKTLDTETGKGKSVGDLFNEYSDQDAAGLSEGYFDKWLAANGYTTAGTDDAITFDDIETDYNNQIAEITNSIADLTTLKAQILDSADGGLKDEDDKNSSDSDKEDKWEFERDYDANIKSKIKGEQSRQKNLETEFEALVNDENATMEDIITKKTQIAESMRKQSDLMTQQYKLDLEEIKKLKQQHPEWSKLYQIDDNGSITWDTEAIKALNLSPEQGEIFDKWYDEMNTASENAQATYGDIVDTNREIAEVLAVIENEYDELYNIDIRLNELAKEREKLEREYNKLLSDSNTTLEDLQQNLQQQYAILEKEEAQAQNKLNFSQSKLESYVKSNPEMAKYVTKDAETGRYMVNEKEMDKAAATGITEIYEKAAEFVDNVLSYQDDVIDNEQEVIDAQEKMVEVLEDGKEAAADLEQTYYDALIEYMDRQIEETEELYSSIDDSNSKLLDSINESLDRQRQARENEKTESDINDMRNRLAYLQMDTSGANANEILSLQKQIKEKEEDYTDTLIDQKIDELEKQNDMAAEQRERQINLLKWSHEEAQKNGSYLKEAQALLSSTINGLPAIVGEIDSNSQQLKNMLPVGTNIKDVIQANYSADGKMPTKTELEKNDRELLEIIAKSSSVVEKGRENFDAGDAGTALRIAEGLEDVSKFSLYELLVYDLDGDGEISKKDADNILRLSVGLAPAYATGGLADFTGPAWLDGTKSRPELVLNQKDTQNFIQLKDILSSLLSNNGSLQNSAENRGDNYYEIHLNVEKITSDYDVEQLATKIKGMIAEDANSRGVNSIYRRR